MVEKELCNVSGDNGGDEGSHEFVPSFYNKLDTSLEEMVGTQRKELLSIYVIAVWTVAVHTTDVLFV